MEYSLSSSLVGGSGSINPDGLSLDLNFAADKTLTARKGPTPVFTRASGSSGGTTYFGVSIINAVFSYNGTDFNVNVPQKLTVTNGKWEWGNGLALFQYTGTAWQLIYESTVVATSDQTSTYFPYLANWYGPIVTATSNFGVVRAATNEPRFDYNPTTLINRGLLIEEQRINQIKYSYNNFTNSYWESTASNVTAVDSAANGPDNLSDGASSITEIAGVAISRHIHETTGVFTPTANTAYTMSAWVKQAEEDPVRYVQLAFWIAGFGSTAYMNFDIQIGAVGTGGAGITASSITAYPNGWYRITATATSVASPAASGFQLGFSTTSGAARTEAYTVVTPLKSIYLWGAQVEAGAFATSYIPTVGSSLTRSADVCTITGSSLIGIYNNAATTIVAKFIPSSLVSGVCGTSDPRDLEIQQTGSGNIIGLSANVASGTSQLSRSGVTVNTSQKFAFASGSSNQAVCLNGGTVLDSPTWVKNSGAGTTFYIGRAGYGGQYTGTVSSLSIYKKRLSNSKLQTLTT